MTDKPDRQDGDGLREAAAPFAKLGGSAPENAAFWDLPADTVIYHDNMDGVITAGDVRNLRRAFSTPPTRDGAEGGTRETQDAMRDMGELVDPVQEQLRRMLHEFGDEHYHTCPAENDSGPCACFAGHLIVGARETLEAAVNVAPTKPAPDAMRRKLASARGLDSPCDNSSAPVPPADATPIGEDSPYWRTLRAALVLPVEEQYAIAKDLAANCGYELTGDDYTRPSPAVAAEPDYADGEAPWSEDEQFSEHAKACRSRRKQYGQNHCGEKDGTCTECEYDAQKVLRKKYPAVAGPPVRGDREASPDDIRAHGWTVAVHNDYRQGGEAHTFWLFTNGRENAKGEGKTDAEALNQVRAILSLPVQSGAGERE